jgi:hypothetical protein
MHVAKETTACFLKGLENYVGFFSSFPLCFSFWGNTKRWWFWAKAMYMYIDLKCTGHKLD